MPLYFYYLMKLVKSMKDFFNESSENKLFISLMLVSVALFIYYFIKTYSQALWFDEADYMNFSNFLAFGFPEWGLGAVRPPLLSLIGALFFKVGLGELGLRLLGGLFYIINILLVYFIGKELFDKKAALIASLLTAVFWSHLFFSFRLLTDVPVLTFWLLSIYIFIKGYIIKENRIYLLLLVPVIIMGFFMKYTNALVAILILLYLVITERFNWIKNKDLWKSLGLSLILLIPFFIFQYFYYGSPFAFLTASFVGRTTLGRSFFQSLIDHIKFFFSPESLGIISLVVSIISIIYLLQIFLGIDLILKNKVKNLNNKLFLFLWLIITLLFAAKLGYGLYIEERYYFNFYVGLFLAAGVFLSYVYDLLKKYDKYLPLIIICVLLIFSINFTIAKADDLITTKAVSFKEVKIAGQFLEKNLADDEYFLSPATSAEIQYHSHRKNLAVPIAESLTNNKIKYVVYSAYNPILEEFTNFIKNNPDNFKPIIGIPFEHDKNQYAVIIFEVVRN